MMNKYEFTAKIVSDLGPGIGSIIDVGCRDAILRTYLGDVRYFGVDIDQESSSDALVDISKRTEFSDNEFDLLIALDVAEHTDDIYATIREMLRISRSSIIALPNLYQFGMRWRFLTGRSLCDKYALTQRNSESGGYRHRWIFTPQEALGFMRSVAAQVSRRVDVLYYYPPQTRFALARAFTTKAFGCEAMYFVFRG